MMLLPLLQSFHGTHVLQGVTRAHVDLVLTKPVPLAVRGLSYLQVQAAVAQLYLHACASSDLGRCTCLAYSQAISTVRVGSWQPGPPRNV